MNNAKNADQRIDAPLEKPAKALVEPFRDFVNAQSASGWVLLGATIAAVLLANSRWGSWYFRLLDVEFAFRLADFEVTMTLQHWVNDGLMAVFFFLLGLELKRELLVGRLSNLHRAMSVLCAATGGIVVPAMLFLLMADDGVVKNGWAIPVATDTAFALMVLVLLGDRIPAAARAFLVGLAIVDDLGAILIIALALTSDFDSARIFPALMSVGVVAMLNLTGVRKGFPYFAAGCAIWATFTSLGLHGTLAGVVAALAAPVRPRIGRETFLSRLYRRLRIFEKYHKDSTQTILEQPDQQAIAQDIQAIATKAAVPLGLWESYLEKPVSFIVMPLFAFLNAGIVLSGASIAVAWASELSGAIMLGLLLGKPAGIVLGIWLGVLGGIARLPKDLTWRHMLGIGLLGGIGFTMSLFITNLSFGHNPELIEIAKQGIIVTSLVAGIFGYGWLRWGCS